MPAAEELKPNRVYKCGCVCPTPTSPGPEAGICPACLVKNNQPVKSIPTNR